MVLKCTHYTTRITLNVLQTGCTVASQLGFEPGSLVWLVGSLPIKRSGLAIDIMKLLCFFSDEFASLEVIADHMTARFKYGHQGCGKGVSLRTFPQ